MTYWHPIKAIEEALKEDGESQASLASRVGWSAAKMSKILSGTQKLDVNDLIDIMEAQGRPASYYWEPPVLSLAKNRLHVIDVLGLTTHQPMLRVA